MNTQQLDLIICEQERFEDALDKQFEEWLDMVGDTWYEEQDELDNYRIAKEEYNEDVNVL